MTTTGNTAKHLWAPRAATPKRWRSFPWPAVAVDHVHDPPDGCRIAQCFAGSARGVSGRRPASRLLSDKRELFTDKAPAAGRTTPPLILFADIAVLVKEQNAYAKDNGN
jgi:hypothetical protein